MSLRRAEPCGIFNVGLYWTGGSFERNFIKTSVLIPNTPMLRFLSAAAERRGIKPDFRIKTISKNKLYILGRGLSRK
jgi:hypothetical protein